MADFGIGEAAAVASAASAAAEAGTSAAALGSIAATTSAATFSIGGLLSSALPYLSLASGAISAGSSLFSGVQKSNMDQLEVTQYEEQASIAKTQAAQQSADRMRQLSSTLATQDAMRSGRGVDLYSPTGLNIRQVSQAAEARDLDTINLNGLDAQQQALLSASLANQRATSDLIGGIGGAAEGLMSGALKSAQSFKDLQKSSDS